MLSRKIVNELRKKGANVANDNIFNLPEKVLQFGTGVLLRGLPDYFIDIANRKGIFNGRIVVVKSTDAGSLTDFEQQDCLYTLNIKGISNGEEVNEEVICSSISRVISANKNWPDVLKIAHNPDLQVVISNTTEAGIKFVQEGIGTTSAPVSFPAKLLAVLYERYQAFNGDPKKGLVIIPTELVVNNGKELSSIILKLCHINRLEEPFIAWVLDCNYFCDSLVDRIVPGKANARVTELLNEQSGYRDNLRIVAEAYCLWAIEGDEQIKSVLSFSEGHTGIVIAEDIEIFRELKLRLLNGTHTLICAIAILCGFSTVKEAMENHAFSTLVTQLMLLEIAPSIPYVIDKHIAEDFAYQVLDRFRNPNIEHLWLSISAQYSLKLKMRVIPMLLNHYKMYGTVPEYFAFGFAAFLRLMKTSKENGAYLGYSNNGHTFIINDDLAAVFYSAWQNADLKITVRDILSDHSLWETDLTLLPGFESAVTKKLEQFIYSDTLSMLNAII